MTLVSGRLLSLSLLFLALCPWLLYGFSNRKIDDPISHCQRSENPKGLGFLGVKYDLLEGNPEGKDRIGGVDPGLKPSQKILKLTYEDGAAVPDQICYEERDSCASSSSSRVFSGTKRYQEKLAVDVSVEAGYSGLFDFAFSASAKYEEMSRSTQSGETVYRDSTTICNKGSARYRLAEVQLKQWTLADGFASDICRLPLKYGNGDDYFNFVRSWGTHVVTGLILGTKDITRFKSTLTELMKFASTNVEGSLSVSGGYGGGSASVSVDVNKFQESEETSKNFGEQQQTYKIGGEDFPEPIQLELTSVEQTLKLKFWGNMEELKQTPNSPCRKINEKKLKKIEANLKTALELYPERRHLERAKENELKLRLAWPEGYYSLHAPQSNPNKGDSFSCPQDQDTGFTWPKGSVTQKKSVTVEFPHNLVQVNVHNKENDDKFLFCSKTEQPSSGYFSPKWPRGRYCIVRKSISPDRAAQCPPGFQNASVDWVQLSNKGKVLSGEYPDGRYDDSALFLTFYYCCRQDAFASNGIHLPLETPFTLVKEGSQCQRVCGATDTEIVAGLTALGLITPSPGGPAIVRPPQYHKGVLSGLGICYYQKMNNAEFFIYKFDGTAKTAREAEQKCQETGDGHLTSIHSRKETEKVRNLMGNQERIWIGMKRKGNNDKSWVWLDESEVDFHNWKSDVPEDEMFAAMNADGTWEARDGKENLPFVCKRINNCPMVDNDV
ncbi:uncharacterized protein [Montipora foliosa]|uniref:uncharacterized protein isoform X1 n=1 Tax=Montipora foliosa TaxID=591990 RepID=UPI0035F1F6DD